MSTPTLTILETRSRLAGPERRGLGDRISSVPVAVTGGGLVAVVHPRTGLQGVWRGRSRAMAALELVAVGGGLGGGGSTLRARSGAWQREIPLDGDRRLRERGLLTDVAAAPAVEWTLLSGEEPLPLTLRLHAPGGHASELQVVVEPGRPTAIALVPADGDPARVRKLLSPLEARERQRERRTGGLDGASFRIELDGSTLDATQGALEDLDDAPLGDPALPPADGSGFLAGVADGVPLLLSTLGTIELGIAASATGRRALAEYVLRTILEAADPAPTPALYLAERYARWAGAPEMLAPFSARLVELASTRSESTPPPGFPAAAPTLRMLLEALEPVGDAGWVREMAGAAEALDRSTHARARRLPVLGGPDPMRAPGPEHSGDGPDTLPAPEAFGRSDTRRHRAERTLRSARLLRSWVENVLGAHPDGAYGRLRFGPEIRTGWADLRVEGIRVADATLELRYRRRGRTNTFRLRQTAGRVPLNLVFEPKLPLARIESVRIGGEAADVQVSGTGDASTIGCQFPLDPEREVSVVGEPGPRKRRNARDAR